LTNCCRCGSWTDDILRSLWKHKFVMASCHDAQTWCCADAQQYLLHRFTYMQAELQHGRCYTETITQWSR